MAAQAPFGEAAPVRPARIAGRPPQTGFATEPNQRNRAFFAFALVTLAYTVAVILFGAVVRITGSGAGCGQHWPTCHGEVAHLPASVETAIELGHRATSGLSLLAVLALMIWGLRAYPRGHLVRRASVLSFLFIVVEALIGAALVLLELVGRNDSLARAAVMGAHLVNTCLLTGAMALVVWGAHDGQRARFPRPSKGTDGSPAIDRLFAWGLVAVVLVSVTGAVTALGDTLFPVAEGGLAGHLGTEGATHFLQQTRAVHPMVAVLAALYLLWVCGRARGSAGTSLQTRSWARLGALLVLLQTGAGAVNVWLSAPGWMQVVHLALANALWLALVFATLFARLDRAQAR